VMLETWNDHEEGTAIEGGIPTCGSPQPEHTENRSSSTPPAGAGKS
jgi:hypothetical protein